MSEKRTPASTTPLLPYDAVFRIEVSLSSQTTSAIVMRTTARLYSLEGTRPRVGNAEWRSVAYGAPCIQLVRLGGRELFTIRVVIAEVESGIALWEGVVRGNSRYGAMQKNFHTFTSSERTYAIQFVNEQEAERMLESMQDLLSQQQQMGRTADPTQTDAQPAVFKKPSRPPRRLSKKDISSPCNFKHVSGITMQRTLSCEQELRGTIQRKMRSLSLSNLSRSKSGDELPDDKVGGGKRRVKTVGRRGPKESPEVDMKRADPQRMSLPSHFRQKERRPLTATSFIPPSSLLNKALSQSSGNISSSHSHTSSSHVEQQTTAHNIERRHTMREPGLRPINYSQAPPPRATGGSETALNKSPGHQEGRGQVQHVAIASSDIVGWTADGRLIVQMPASQGGPEVGVATGNPTPTRRASTGQFAQDQSFPPLKHGSSDMLPTQTQQASQKSFHHSVSDRTVRNRPLPPTPLDVVMPNSTALRTKPALTPSPVVAMATTPTDRPIGSKKQSSSNVLHSTASLDPSLQPHTSSSSFLPHPSSADEPSTASHAHSDSVEASLQEVTDQMSRALAQFDDLLGVVQTSL